MSLTLAPNATAPTQWSENPRLTPAMLSHAAWVTHDVAATAEFYTGIMGMELASTVIGPNVSSTGDDFPYFHIFFRMGDGSTVAFFEVPGLPERAEVAHAGYKIFDHLALQVSNTVEVERWRDWLTSNGVDVVGPTPHDGMIYSIYFYDPNGMRLEITTPTDPDWNNHTEEGRKDLAWWCEAKEAARASSEPLKEVMRRMIEERPHSSPERA